MNVLTVVSWECNELKITFSVKQCCNYDLNYSMWIEINRNLKFENLSCEIAFDTSAEGKIPLFYMMLIWNNRGNAFDIWVWPAFCQPKETFRKCYLLINVNTNSRFGTPFLDSEIYAFVSFVNVSLCQFQGDFCICFDLQS